MYDLRALQSFKRRLGLCLGLVGLLGPVQVAHAFKLNDFKNAGATTTANSAKIGMPPGGSTIPIAPTDAGWTLAGNYGVAPGAKGPTVNFGGKGEVLFAGVKYPFQANYVAPASNIFTGLATAAEVVGGVMGGPAGLAIMLAGVAAPFIAQWAQDAKVRIDPSDPTKIQKGDLLLCTTGTCYEWRYAARPWSGMRSPALACQDYVNGYLLVSFPSNGYYYVGSTDTTCSYGATKQGISGGTVALQKRTTTTQDEVWTPVTDLSQVAQPFTNTSFDPRVLPEILAKGGDVPLPAPTVSGPSELPGPQEVVKNPDGSTTTKSSTQKFSTSGDTITNITNVTTTITQNSSSQVINSSTSTTTPSGNTEPAPDLCKTNPNSVACASKDYLDRIITAITALGTKLDTVVAKLEQVITKLSNPTQQQTDCDKHPNAVGCKDLDTPTGEIPKSSVALTYEPEDHFGGGSCPADKTMTITGGPTVVVWDWAGACSKITSWVRPLLLALAAFGALMILAPGLKGDD